MIVDKIKRALVFLWQKVVVSVWRKVVRGVTFVWRQVVTVFNLFVEKVVLPLYKSIANKLKALWKVCVAAWRVLTASLLSFYNMLASVIKGGARLMLTIVKKVSRAYS